MKNHGRWKWKHGRRSQSVCGHGKSKAACRLLAAGLSACLVILEAGTALAARPDGAGAFLAGEQPDGAGAFLAGAQPDAAGAFFAATPSNAAGSFVRATSSDAAPGIFVPTGASLPLTGYYLWIKKMINKRKREKTIALSAAGKRDIA